MNWNLVEATWLVEHRHRWRESYHLYNIWAASVQGLCHRARGMSKQ